MNQNHSTSADQTTLLPPLSKAPAIRSAINLNLPKISSAPEVDTYGLENQGGQIQQLHTSLSLNHQLQGTHVNAKLQTQDVPFVGPLHPQAAKMANRTQKNIHMGHIELAGINEFSFNDQMLTFDKYGLNANNKQDSSKNPWGKSVLLSKKRDKKAEDIAEKIAIETETGADPSPDRKRIRQENALDLDNFQGPWAKFEGEEDRKIYWEKQQQEIRADRERERLEAESKGEKVKKDSAIIAANSNTVVATTSLFYGKAEYDYQQRPWCQFKATADSVGQDKRNLDQMLDSGESWCYLPKKLLHTFTGHTAGVQCCRLIPKTGHLLLTGGLDCKVKIWDMYNNRQCLRDYMGHDIGIKDVRFTDDGSKFYSCSFDKNINLWDVETGKIITTFSNGKTPFCLAVHPDPSQQNIFIAGCSNKKAVQWDANTGQIVQEYDEHLGSVAQVHFCENGKKLVTSSDDKKILIWEYGIPVVTKYISEPSMHYIPSITVHPTKKFFCGQSMDNKIVTYEAQGRFKFFAQKKFTAPAYLSAGFGCEIGFSPDGQFVSSGDGSGKLWFWSFKNQRNLKTISDAHPGHAVLGCCWHPKHTSRVVTCGYDGLVKLWD